MHKRGAIMSTNSQNSNVGLTNYRKKNKQLNVTISNNTYELFVKYCDDMNITKKDAIEKMIKEYIKYNR